MATYWGRCHCGAIGFTYSTDLPPGQWSVRACQCSFCRAHGALTTSDPRGGIRFHAARLESLSRYRFGLRTADFMLCRDCGVYIGAAMRTSGRTFSIINVNALDPMPEALAAAQPMSYEDETTGERTRRRTERWSPSDGALL